MLSSSRHRLRCPLRAAGLWAVALCTVATAEPAKRYDLAEFVRVDVRSDAEIDALERTGAIILNCVPGVGPMDVVAFPEQLAKLRDLGLAVQVRQDNVQTLIDTQQGAVAVADPFDDFFLSYHSYGDAATPGTIVWYLNELAARYPDLASMVDVGTTLERRTIWGLRITNDSIAPKPAVVYFGCEHAREWITATVPPYVATYLLENYGVDAAVTDLVDHVEFFLVPVFNVDGYVYSRTFDRFWRKNRRYNWDGSNGVDLNRNWAEGWGGVGSSINPNSETYHGPAPFSEPETQALRDFFLSHPNVRAQLDIHSYGELILWPHGYTPDLSPDHSTYADLGWAMQSSIENVHGRYYHAGPLYSTIYPASGVSVDWTYAQLDILSFSYELRPIGGGLSGFALPADQIIPNNEEILPAILHMTNADWVRLPVRFEFPDGLPSRLTAGADTPVTVNVISQFQTPVPTSARLFYRYESDGPFLERSLTYGGGDSYTAVLPATNCTSTPEFYFQVTGDGGTMATSPTNAPEQTVYTADVISDADTFYSEPLNANPPWRWEGLWSWGQPFGGGGERGGPDPFEGHTGSAVFGYNLFGDYDNNMSPYHLTSAPIDCTSRTGVHLSYWRWLGVDQPDKDHAAVSVSSNRTDWVTVWENTSEILDSSWVRQDIDVSAVADGQPTVYLRWTMGPTDATRRYCGWNIDDVELSTAECVGMTGDVNGDGLLDDADYAEFANCFDDVAETIRPGCGIFDFDQDDDLDCDDWLAFYQSWGGSGDPPIFETCDAFTPPTADSLRKNRYVSFVPGGSLQMPQAFRFTVAENPLFPETIGRQMWVGTPDANGVSRLRCSPLFRLWGYAKVEVADAAIVPGAAYAIEATLDGETFLEPVTAGTVPLWGDVAGCFENGTWPPPDGRTDMCDVLAQLSYFQRLDTAPPMSWCDLAPGAPDGGVDLLDLVHLLRSFSPLGYPFSTAPPCPEPFDRGRTRRK